MGQCEAGRRLPVDVLSGSTPIDRKKAPFVRPIGRAPELCDTAVASRRYLRLVPPVGQHRCSAMGPHDTI